MYKHKWAAIIYGRSYHLDFRFITIPEDFTEPEKNWAANYILATFGQANKLSSRPRWSLFKNESHCVIGVTCMVRDLLVDMERNIIDLLSKDNRGRPLYVFVGYVTQLEHQKRLLDFPPFAEQSLQNFQDLYQYILEVWWVEEYYKNSKKPILNEYQPLDFQNQKVKLQDTLELAKQINHQKKYPEQTYLWQNTIAQKHKLWITAAMSHESISVCLGDRNMRNIVNSPFLNQTAVSESSEIIEGCAIKKISAKKNKAKKANQNLQTAKSKIALPAKETISQAIANKVKEDIDITVHHATIVKNKSRNLLQNLSNYTARNITQQQRNSAKDADFGFKSKPNDEEKGDRPKEWF